MTEATRRCTECARYQTVLPGEKTKCSGSFTGNACPDRFMPRAEGEQVAEETLSGEIARERLEERPAPPRHGGAPYD